MLLQLAESLSCMPKTKIKSIQQPSYVRLPKDKILVREDHFDRMPLKQMAETLSENGYSPAEISELAGKRAQRKAAAPKSGGGGSAAPAKRGGGGGAARPGKARRQDKKDIRVEKKRGKAKEAVNKKKAKTDKVKGKAAIKYGKADKQYGKGQKQRDKGAAAKMRGEAKIVKASQTSPEETDDIMDTMINTAVDTFAPEQDENYGGEGEYNEETYNPEDAEFVEAEEVDPEEFAEQMAASRKEKVKSALIKGLTTAATAYKDSGKKPAATVKLPVKKPVAVKPKYWEQTFFQVGNFRVSRKGAAIGGSVIALTGLVLTRPRSRK